MPTIDDKIVQMTFDNKQFERGVKQSIGSLEELKRALDLDKSAQSLSNLEKVASEFDISGIEKGIDSIADRFTLMGNIGQEIFHRISKTAVDAMQNVWNTVTGMPKAGLGKYEMKNKAVQMIQGALPEKSLEEIEKVLERLNEYTDLTSYDFSQMAQSIGKFTAAGVDLDVAEKVMEGIANEAASAGGEIQQANIAMYNFSQALAAGSVKALDWRSIENQNLATKEFKETIIDTASELGILQKRGDGVGALLKRTSKGTKEVVINFENFSKTLSEGWFTSDVLIKTMEKYADRESEVGKKGFEMAKIAITLTQALDAVKDAISTQWMKTWQYLLGDLEEAGKLFTMISDALIGFTDRIGNFRNTILEGWHTGGEDGISGYTMAVQSLANVFSVLEGFAEATSRAIKDVFGDIDSSGLITATSSLKTFTDGLKDFFGYSEETDVQIRKILRKKDDFEEWTHDLMRGLGSTKEPDEEVRKLQERLMSLGNDLIKLDKYGADGIFGPETQAALKAFQKSVGLEETGIYDKKTRDSLVKAIYPKGQWEYIEKEIEHTTTHVGEGLDLVRRALKGVLSLAKGGIGVVSIGLKIVGKVASMLTPVAKGILSVTAGLGDGISYIVDFVSALLNGESAMTTFNAFLTPISKTLSLVGGFLENVGDGISVIFGYARKATNFEELGKLLSIDPENNKNAIAIYNALAKIRDIGQKVAPVFENIGNTLSKFFDSASKWISGKFTSALNSISTFFNDLWKKIQEGDYITKILNGVGTALQVILSIIGGVGYGVYALGSAFVDGAKAVYDFVENSEFVKSVWESISKFFEPVVDFFKSVWESLTNIRGIMPSFKSFDQFWSSFMSEMAKNPIGKTFIPALTKLKSVLKAPIDLIRSFTESISTAFTTLKKFRDPENALTELMKDPEKNKGAINVIKFLKKIQLILEKIKPIISTVKQAISNVFGKISPVLKEFGSSVWNAITGFFNGEEGNSISETFEKIKNWILTAWVDIKTWWNNLVANSPFLQGLAKFGELLWQGITGFFGADTSNIEGLGNKLAERLKAFDPLIDWFKEKYETIKAIFSGEGSLLEKIKKFFSVDEGSILGSILSGAKSLGESMSNIDLGDIWDGIKKGLNLIILATIVKTLSRFSKILAVVTGAQRQKGNLGKTVLQIAISMGIIAGALHLLAKVPVNDAIKGVAVMSLALGALLGAMAIASTIGEGAKDFGKSILAIAAAIGLVVLSIWGASKLISNTDGSLMLKSLGMISGVLVVLSGVAWALSKFGSAGGSVGAAAIVLSICVGLNLIVRAIGKMAAIIKKYPDDAVGAFGIVEGLLITLGTIATLMSRFSGVGGSIGGAALVLALCFSLGMVVSAIGDMAKVIKKYPDDAVGAFGMVEGILVTLGGIAVLLSTFGNGLSALSLAASAVPIIAMSYAIQQIADSMSEAIVKVKDVNPEVISAFLNGVDAAVAVLAVVVAGFAAIPVTGFLSASVGFVAVISAIGAGIDIAASFVSDAMKKLSTALWLVGSRLADFSNFLSRVNFQMISNGMKTVVDDVLPTIARMPLQKNAVEEAKSVAESMKQLGTKLELFYDSITKIADPDKIVINEMAGKIQEAVNTINGINGTKEAIDVLESLGAAFGLYYGNLKMATKSAGGDELEVEGNFDIEKANEAFQDLADLTLSDETLEKIKSYADGGDHDLNGFAEGIQNLGVALSNYGTSIGTLDDTAIKTANDVLDKVSGIQTSLNSVDSWDEFLGILLGKKSSLSEFGDNIVILGNALGNYGRSVGDLPSSQITKANRVLTVVRSLNENLPSTGGILAFFGGQKRLDEFAANMSALGDGMQQYANKVSDANFSNVSDSLTPLQTIASVYNSLEKTGGLDALVNGTKDLGSVASGMADFAETLSKAQTDKVFENFKADDAHLASAMDTLEKIIGFQVKIQGIDNDTMALQNLGISFRNFFENLASVIDPSYENTVGDTLFEDAQDAIDSFLNIIVDTITDNTESVNAMETLIKNVIDKIGEFNDDFEGAGENMDLGLAKGLANRRSEVLYAAEFVAKAALIRVKSILGIHSPSEEFMNVGKMVVAGFAGGLINNVDSITDAGSMIAKSLTGSTIEGAEKAIKGLQSIIDNGIDDTMTITPVTDMSVAQGQIDSWFSSMTGRTVNTGLNLANDISSGSGVTIVQNGVNDGMNSEIANAISDLNNRMDGIARSMANLRVIMDTGALVGQIAGPIDERLGEIAYQYNRRG